MSDEQSADPVGYVYFVYAAEAGVIKIGFTMDRPWKRLCALQTASPVDLVVMGVVRGPAKLERLLHKKFRKIRKRYEWFHATPELIDFIHEVAETWPENGKSFVTTRVFETPLHFDNIDDHPSIPEEFSRQWFENEAKLKKMFAKATPEERRRARRPAKKKAA